MFVYRETTLPFFTLEMVKSSGAMVEADRVSEARK